MTREEFINDIDNLDSLYDFCCENDMYEIFDDRYIQSYDSFNDWIAEYYLDDLASNYDWETVRCQLNDIRDMIDDYSWFSIEGTPYGVSQRGREFEEMKDEAYDWACDRGIFDDDEDILVENEVNEEEFVYEFPHQHSNTQVIWGVASEKPKEESIFIPQEDISMLF